MHLALIISSLQTGGAERVLSELANAWISRGYEVSLITFSTPGEVSIYPLDPQVNLIELNQIPSENLSLLARLNNITKRILTLRKTLKVVKPDVVISFVDVMNITTLLASRRLSVPVIVSERIHPAYHPFPLVYKILRYFTYPWADKLIAQTESASGYFSNLPEEKKAIIPNAVKKPLMQKGESAILKPVRQIISVGRLTHQKAFPILIQAFSEISLVNPDLKLTIYGEGEMRGDLEKLIQQLQLTERVFLPGTIKDIETELNKADLFIFPSYYEGFPNALCEAMAIGLPVIASNCSGTVDILRDHIDGRLFNVGDAPQLTRFLQELIDDAGQRATLSKGALGVVERFSQSSILQKWDEVLDEVLRH
jgi:glycosyltransferase involved in cell wall biosynthesis